MSETTTKVIGYFNPHNYPIFIEISEINLKTELAPKAYVLDRNRQKINDPVFEQFCHAKGLARALSEQPLPIKYVPRFVRTQRPGASVTQAKSFVRDSGGKTVPTFAPAQTTDQRKVAENQFPIVGMSMESARKMGLVGKPRLVPEDFGADETSGAPKKVHEIPDMRYSMESAPKANPQALLRSPSEQPTNQIKPPGTVPLKAPDAPVKIVPGGAARAQARQNQPPADTETPEQTPSAPAQPPRPATPRPPAARRQNPQQKRRVAEPIVETTAPAEPLPEQAPPPPPPSAPPTPRQTPVRVEPIAQVEEDPNLGEEMPPEEPMSGVVQPINEEEAPTPNLAPPPQDMETGRRFVCAADGRSFTFRSELERHVKRHYAAMSEELMAPYPPDTAPIPQEQAPQ